MGFILKLKEWNLLSITHRWNVAKIFIQMPLSYLLDLGEAVQEDPEHSAHCFPPQGLPWTGRWLGPRVQR